MGVPACAKKSSRDLAGRSRFGKVGFCGRAGACRTRLRLAPVKIGPQLLGQPRLPLGLAAGRGRGCIHRHQTRCGEWRASAQAPLDKAAPHRHCAHQPRSRLVPAGCPQEMVCCCSSVVERILGKAEVGSSILPSSTIPSRAHVDLATCARRAQTSQQFRAVLRFLYRTLRTEAPWQSAITGPFGVCVSKRPDDVLKADFGESQIA